MTGDETLGATPRPGPQIEPHEDRLSEILADPSLPDRDKRQALQEALDDLQRERGDAPAAAYEPIEQRFFEALNLLADGGHDYEGAGAPDDPPEVIRDR